MAKDNGVSFHLVSATAPNPCKQSPPLPSSHPRPASLNSPCRLLPYTACVSVFLLALSLQSVLLISIQNKRTSSADLVPFLFLPEPIFVIYTVFIFPKGRCNQRWQGSQFFRVMFEWSNDSQGITSAIPSSSSRRPPSTTLSQQEFSRVFQFASGILTTICTSCHLY